MYKTYLDRIEAETKRAVALHGEFSSLHEAYAVMLEELDEIWEIVREKRENRSSVELETEFIQLAAMCYKALHSLNKFVGPLEPRMTDTKIIQVISHEGLLFALDDSGNFYKKAYDTNGSEYWEIYIGFEDKDPV